MLLTVGGMMLSLAMPGRSVPTLAVTAAATAINLIRQARQKKKKDKLKKCEAQKQPVTVEWSDVTLLLNTSKSSKSKIILDSVSGCAKPGRVLAILGPSGSGKTSLLNAIADRLSASSKMELYGHISRNGVSRDDDHQPIAYVTQEDFFFSQLSVKETLEMAAKLRLPATMSHEQKNAVVETLIRNLGLVSAADSRVGDEKTRGISGGEKKRLSLGCELISTPKLIICDEPTSGLDAFQAEHIMQTLQKLAKEGHTVICSIHQPSSSIFKMCDDIVLLSGGRVVYTGPTVDAPAHFKKEGYPLPSQCNPAERYLDLISIDFSSDQSIVSSHSRIDHLVGTFRESQVGKTAKSSVQTAKTNEDTSGNVSTKPLGIFEQVRLLLQRAWRQVTRDRKTNVSRFMSSFMSALLFGAIYWRIGKTQTTIQDRLGLLQVCTINCAMTALVKTLHVFPKESVLINRERVRGSYDVPQYFISKLLAEMPVSAFFPLVFSLTVYPMVQLSSGLGKILRFMGIITLESFTAASYGLAIGALMPSTEAALAVGPSSFVLQIVFGGLYVTDENVPGWASWIPRISLIKHAYEGLCVNEFRGLEFKTQKGHDVKTGEQVLQRMTWGKSTVAKTCISQARVLLFNYLATFAILTLKKPRFEKIRAPEEVDENVIEADQNANQAKGTKASSKPAVTSDGVDDGPVKAVPNGILPSAKPM